MSVTREWVSLKTAWIILLIMCAVRIFLSSRFLLTPDEAAYWQAGQYAAPWSSSQSPFLSWAVRLSTTLFGINETAVRLPAILGLALAVIYMMLLAASMFSWHTALHVTLLSHGVLLFNLAALILSPYCFLLPCWAATCYHTSQGMNDNRIEQWLFAGFWFGLGLLVKFSMALILPCLILCFILIRPYRTCLFYPGPWLGLLLSLGIFIAGTFGLQSISLGAFIQTITLFDITRNLIPDPGYSFHFFIDQVILLTPVILFLVLAGWLTGSRNRHLAKPNVHFLTLTSLPVFLLYLIFPFFADKGPLWPAPIYSTAIIFIAGLHSSTRSNFKGSPNRRWIFGLVTAYGMTILLILQISFSSLHLPLLPGQTRFLTQSGWEELSKEMDRYVQQLPPAAGNFIFSLDPKISAELAFYLPGNPRTVSLDYLTRSNHSDFLEKELQLAGKDGLGLVTTRAGLDQAAKLFDRIELKKKGTWDTNPISPAINKPVFYIIRGFNFISR